MYFAVWPEVSHKHATREVRRLHEVVAALQVEVSHVVLELLAEEPAARVPHGEARPELLGEREQVELAAELAVVAAFGLLQAVQVRVEVVLRRPRRAVDPR